MFLLLSLCPVLSCLSAYGTVRNIIMILVSTTCEELTIKVFDF